MLPRDSAFSETETLQSVLNEVRQVSLTKLPV